MNRWVPIQRTRIQLGRFQGVWDPFLEHFTSIFAYFSSHFDFIFESILAQFPLPEAPRGPQNRGFWEDDKTCQKCDDFEMPRGGDFRSKTHQKIDRNFAEILYAFCIDFERQKDAENHPKITSKTMKKFLRKFNEDLLTFLMIFLRF